LPILCEAFALIITISPKPLIKGGAYLWAVPTITLVYRPFFGDDRGLHHHPPDQHRSQPEALVSKPVTICFLFDVKRFLSVVYLRFNFAFIIWKFMIKALNSWIRKKGDRHLGRHAAYLVWMGALFAVFGAIQFFEPLEDLAREGRNVVRSQPASGDIVFVGIDAKSLQELPNLMGDRNYDVKLVENLFNAGAKHIYYDRVHGIKGTPSGDDRFGEILKKYEGRLFIGHAGPIDNLDVESNFPNAESHLFLNDKNKLSITAALKPFSLSFDIPYVHAYKEKKIQTFSAHMAGKETQDLGKFRPDFSIQSSSVKSFSYSDIFNGKFSGKSLQGKMVVIGLQDTSLGDVVHLPSQGHISGAYVHIIAAETLTKGTPRDFGWLALFGLSLVASAAILFVRSRRVFLALAGGAVLSYALVPFALDVALVKIDILPGFLLVLAVSVRSLMTRLSEDSAQTNRETGIKNFIGLRNGAPFLSQTLVAIKVRNFAAIAGRFDRTIEADVYHEISRRIALMTPNPQVYQSADTLVWLTDMAPNTDLLNSLHGINNLMQASNFVIDDVPVEVSLAFGIDGDASRSVELRLIDALANAENAAQANRLYSVASDEARLRESRKLDLLAGFDSALIKGEIWAAFQPKYDTKTKQFESAEALARWSHDSFGVISAGEFISLAESHNRITELTIAILDQTINTLKLTQKIAPNFSISVNISPRLILAPNFESMILDRLNADNVPPHLLTLEIIETEKLDIDQAEPVLRRLAAQGIRLSVDDYGTGQATLDYLRTDLFHEIKIDRNFISKMDVSESDCEMVQATIRMAHSLGKLVVAEGIEHDHIGKMLAQMGCDEVQGFHYAMPMPCNQLMTLIDVQYQDQKSLSAA
jgi:diguanylate cyclase